MLMMMTEPVSHLGSLSHGRLGYLARARRPSRISSSMRQHDIKRAGRLLLVAQKITKNAS